MIDFLRQKGKKWEELTEKEKSKWEDLANNNKVNLAILSFLNLKKCFMCKFKAINGLRSGNFLAHLATTHGIFPEDFKDMLNKKIK